MVQQAHGKRDSVNDDSMHVDGMSWAAANPYVAYPVGTAATLMLVPCECISVPACYPSRSFVRDKAGDNASLAAQSHAGFYTG